MVTVHADSGGLCADLLTLGMHHWPHLLQVRCTGEWHLADFGGQYQCPQPTRVYPGARSLCSHLPGANAASPLT
jgi:hypothetical protein